MGSRTLSFLITGLLLLAVAGCSRGPNVSSTIPTGGATNVAANTNIEVRFSRVMDESTVTDASNYILVSSQGRTYDLNIDYDAATRVATLNPSSRNNPDSDDFSFGENVEVTLTSGIRSGGNIPLDTYRFDFTTLAPTPLDPEPLPAPEPPGDFGVLSVEPSPNSGQHPVSPQIRVTFGEAVFNATVTSSTVILRGETSGFHAANIQLTDTVPDTLTSTGILVTPVSPFLPGERVTLTLTGGIEAPPTILSIPGDEGAPQPIPDPTALPGDEGNQTLTPFVLDFLVSNAGFDDAFSDARELTGVGGATALNGVVGAAFGEFLPQNGGVEVILADADQGLFLQRESADLQIVESTFVPEGSPVAICPCDWDSNGVTDLALLTRDPAALTLLEVLNAELIVGVDAGEPLRFVFESGIDPRDLAVADIDGNGVLDYVIVSDQGISIAEPIETSGSVRTVIQEFLVLEGETYRQVQVADLDENGLPDLVISDVSFDPTGNQIQLRVLRNLGEFVFDEPTTLEGAQNTPFRSWDVGDLEGDGDVDIVLAVEGGLRVFDNPGGTIPAPSWPNRLLQLAAGEPDAVRIADLDGNEGYDLLTYHRGTGVVSVLRRIIDTEPEPDPVPPPGPEPLNDFVGQEVFMATGLVNAEFALGDLSKDSGLDIVLHGLGNENSAFVSETEGATDPGGGPETFTYSTPGVVMGNIQQAEFEVPVTASLSTGISSFEMSFNYRQDGLDFLGADPGPSVVITGTIDNPTTGTITLTGESANPTIPIFGNSVDLVTFRFELECPVTLGEMPYGFTVIPPGLNTVVIAETGETSAVDISGGNGSITTTTELDGVTDLACAPALNNVVELTWTLPLQPLNQITVLRNGAFHATLAGNATSHSDPLPLNGDSTYSVIGSVAGNNCDDIPTQSATCSLFVQMGVMITICDRTPSETSTTIRIEWTTEGLSYDAFEIRRDGNFVTTVAGTQTVYQENIDENAHTYLVIGVVDGEPTFPASCEIQAIEGQGGETLPPVLPPVDPPVIVDGNAVTLNWANGQSYDMVEVTRSSSAGSVLFPLPGGTISLVDDGLLPDLYSYEVVGTKGGVPSTALALGGANVLLVAPTNLVCTEEGGNDVTLNWENPYPGADPVYDSQDVLRDDQVVASLAGDATTFVDNNLADGEYSFSIRGIRAAASADSTPCSATIENSIQLSSITAAPGSPLNRLSVTAQVLDTVISYQFTVEYESTAFEFFNTPDGVLVETPFPQATVLATDNRVAGGTKRSVTVNVSGVSVPPGQTVELAQLVGRIPASFASVGESAVDLISATFVYQSGQSVPLEIEEGEGDATITIVDTALQVDDMVALAASGSEIVVPVYATFSEDLLGYTVILDYDPSIFQCTLVTELGTVAQDLNPLFIDEDIDNVEGQARLAMIVEFTPGEVVAIDPSIRAILAFFVFEVQDGVNPGLSTPLEFGSDDSGTAVIENVLVTLVGQQTESTPPFLLPAEVNFVASGGALPQPIGVTPAEGPLAGGGTASIVGTGFKAGGEVQVFFGGSATPAIILAESDSLLHVEVPPAEFMDGDLPANITVSHGLGQGVLTGAYTYRELTIDSVSPPFGDPAGGEAVAVFGRGFTAGAEVLFGEVMAEVTGISGDARQLFVVTPESAELGSVDVTVTLPDGQTFTRPNAFEYGVESLVPVITGVDPTTGPAAGGTPVTITGNHFSSTEEVLFGGQSVAFEVVSNTELSVVSPGGSGAVDITVTNVEGSDTEVAAFSYEPLSFTSLRPEMVTECGGATVTIAGGGMVSGMQVRFGTFPATNVVVDPSGTSATCTTPAVPEGTGTVGVELENPGGEIVSAPDAITFGTEFVRGDVDDSGTVALNDAILISAFIIGSGPTPGFLDAADANDDGLISVGDVIYIANFVNAGGPPPPAPYPDPGIDMTPDGLGDCP